MLSSDNPFPLFEAILPSPPPLCHWRRRQQQARWGHMRRCPRFCASLTHGLFRRHCGCWGDSNSNGPVLFRPVPLPSLPPPVLLHSRPTALPPINRCVCFICGKRKCEGGRALALDESAGETVLDGGRDSTGPPLPWPTQTDSEIPSRSGCWRVVTRSGLQPLCGELQQLTVCSVGFPSLLIQKTAYKFANKLA